MPFLAILVFLFGLGLSGPAPAASVALVVGNGAYVQAPALPNPPNDARAVAAALRRLGFDVVEGYDLDKRGLEGALRRFGERVSGADIAFAFFAGHGLQVAGQNYLLPTDAKLVREQDLRYEAVPMETLLEEMQGARKVRIVVLDACRNNPFADRMARSMPAGRSAVLGRGLARVDGLGVDTLVAYATAADDIALDGTDSNSPFTKALLQHMETAGLDVRLLFGRVRDSVIEQTGGKQKPFIYGSLGGAEVALRPAAQPAAQPAAVPVASAPVGPAPVAQSLELAFWTSIKDSGSAADYKAYLEQFPNGTFAGLARNRLGTTEMAEARKAPTAPLPVPDAAAADPCRDGERFFVYSDDAWFPATVHGTGNQAGFCKVRFDNYSAEEDEMAGPDRMRPFTPDGPGSALGRCAPDQPVVAESEGVWYPATVVKASANGKCLVRYEDTAIKNESLPLVRLRSRP